MDYPKSRLLLLNSGLKCASLNLLPLNCLHFIPLPFQCLGSVQLADLKHEFLLRPHIHELSRQRILNRMMTVRMLNHLFQLLHVFFLEPLHTLPCGPLIVGHVVVPRP